VMAALCAVAMPLAWGLESVKRDPHD
jgi:hypothetical protein